MTAPILDQINIVSGDLDTSIAFYRRLGVEVPAQGLWRTDTGTHHASAALQDTSGAIDLDFDSAVFAQVWNSGWRSEGDLRGRIVLGFKLDSRNSVDDTYLDLTRQGYRGLQPPYDAFWGSRYAIIEDPDGIAVGLMSPSEEQYRSVPPAV
jgi:uncharacterized glyoxalase superfamily protein PhnB